MDDTLEDFEFDIQDLYDSCPCMRFHDEPWCICGEENMGEV